MKNSKYTKTLAKIQTDAIFYAQEIRRIFLPKFIEPDMQTQCCCPSGWSPTPRPETNGNRVVLINGKFIS